MVTAYQYTPVNESVKSNKKEAALCFNRSYYWQNHLMLLKSHRENLTFACTLPQKGDHVFVCVCMRVCVHVRFNSAKSLILLTYL